MMKNIWKYLLICFFALVLVVVTYELPKIIPNTFNEQAYIVNKLSQFRIEKIDNKVLADVKNNFVFVNTTYDLSLGHIATKDKIEYQKRGKATTAITNRRLLFELFKWLEDNQDHYKIIITDILFYSESFTAEEQAYDDSLGGILKRLANAGKVILAADYNGENVLKEDLYTSNIEPQHYGDVRVNIESEKESVYLLSAEDRVPSMPLLMLNRIDSIQHDVSSFGLLKFTYPNGHEPMSFNYIIPKLYITPSVVNNLNIFGFVDFNSEINYLNLGDVSTGTHAKLKSILSKNSGKNVFVGAFSGDHPDIHSTIYGNTDGALYLLNVYYNLIYKNSLIDWFAAFLLFVFYALCLVWIVIVPHKTRKNTTLAKFLFNTIVAKNWHYIFLVLMVVVYYFCFDQVINVLYISALFLVLEIIIKIRDNYLEIKLKELHIEK